MTPCITEPEFCPRPTCRYYDREVAAAERWYDRFGSFFTRCRGRIPRFRCRACGKTCSTQTFSLHYWTHSTEDYQGLLKGICSCSGLRQQGRFVDVSFRVVQNRLRHLSRNCLTVLDGAAAGLSLAEDLVMDGFESYTRSQYFPNNITVLVGSASQYVYAAVHTLLRRKGRMTDAQRENRARIDAHWRPRGTALREDCALLLADQASMIGLASRNRPITLWSDEHRDYPHALQMVPALKQALAQGRIEHRTVSSRAARTRSNPLFPVNYLDRQIRANMGEHVRETIKQGREVNCQMERMAIFLVSHNFLTPHRIGDGVRLFSRPTHADRAGIRPTDPKRCLTRLFTHRHIWGHSTNRYSWQRKVWQHEYENPPAVDFATGAESSTPVALPPRGLCAHFLA
jgi:hypothetical protein